MRDHLISSNPSWARVLELVEQMRMPFTLDKQIGSPMCDGVELHLPFISTQRWAFIGNHLAPAVYQRRLSLVGEKTTTA